ncbi:MAG: hypothetical protein MJ209_00345 [archaeon]|nr:hypothetical protein [archaeon]
MLVLQEKNRALEANNRHLCEDVEKANQAVIDLTNERKNLESVINESNKKNIDQAKELTNLNIKVKTLEGKITDLTNDWASDCQAGEKQINILKAELTSANKICGAKANLIETLKEENSVLSKGIVKRNIVNFILCVCTIVLFAYICTTI